MAPVYSRVCRERLADEYVSRHDSYAQRLWTDSLPHEVKKAWKLKPVDLPKDFDFKQCSQPVLDGLCRRGILDKLPEPQGPQGPQAARAVTAGPTPEDNRVPFDRREAMKMLNRRIAAAVAEGHVNPPPNYSKFCPESGSIVLHEKPRQVYLFCPYLPFLPALVFFSSHVSSRLPPHLVLSSGITSDVPFKSCQHPSPPSPPQPWVPTKAHSQQKLRGV